MNPSRPTLRPTLRKDRFPGCLFDFKDYDGARLLAVFALALSCIYFASGLFNLLTWQNSWLLPDFALKIGYFLYHLLVFLVVFCLTWLIFDRRSIEGYVLAVYSLVLGIAYIILPTDFVPDPIPLAGTLDDAAVGGTTIILGVVSWMRARRRNAALDQVRDLLAQGRKDEALAQLLCREGIPYTPERPPAQTAKAQPASNTQEPTP